MKNLTRSNIFSLLLLLVALIFAGSYVVDIGKGNIKNNVKRELASYGFSQAQVGEFIYTDGRAILSNIKLDNDGFSTIDSISAQIAPLAALTGGTYTDVIIDNMKLTGDYNSEVGLDISGWSKKIPNTPRYGQILVNGAQLDLMTNAGAIRLQAKGVGQRNENGALAVKGMFWGLQHQLKFETNWNGFIYPDGKWEAAFDIANAGLNLERMQASRMNGWVTLTKTKTPEPEISGQIDAGMFTFGDLTFSNFRMTLNGPYNNYQLIATGEISGHPDMQATLEINKFPTAPQVRAVIEANTIDELMAFLTDLQTSDTKAGTFTKLLLTSGNLDRLQGDIGKLTYDALELEINGPLYDLAGKIIVKNFRDGITERRVFSLDPGDPDNG